MMSDTRLSLVPAQDIAEVPSIAAALEILSEALRGRMAVSRRRLAEGREANATEALALLQGYRTIDDVEVRQALLDVVTILSGQATP